MWILFSRIASAFREWWYFSRLSRIRSGRRRGRKVYESWVMVKIPLLWNFFRSFPVMFANKLRSSFSRAFCRQKALEKEDRKSTRLNSSHGYISYAVFCLKKKKQLQLLYSHPLHVCSDTS